MWFGSVFMKTLRESRIAVLGWGIGIGLLMLELQAALGALMATPGARAQLSAVASQFSWNADAVRVDTVGGYATWKAGFSILIIAIWPLLAMSRTLRGAEERGSMDVLLSHPRGRGRVALESIGANWTAIVLMNVILALITYAGGAGAHADYTVVDALLFGLNLALICGVFGSISLFVSQFTQERATAAGVTGGLLFAFIVIDMVHRIVPGTSWLSHLSPVYYFNLSKPLVPSFGTNAAAMLLLAGISAALTGLSVWMFARRDIGRVAVLSARAAEHERRAKRLAPESAWSLRSVYGRAVANMSGATIWWTVGIAGFGAFTVLVVSQAAASIQRLAQSSSFMTTLFTQVGGSPAGANDALMSSMFVFMPLLVMAFAVTQANRWASDEEEGRQELIVSAPHPRVRVLWARYAAIATSAVFIGVVACAITLLSAAGSGLQLDSGHVVAATLSIVPQCLLMAAIGYLFSGWLRAAIDSGVLSFLLVIWFFISFIGPELGWSPVVMHFSAFYYYGTPLANGLPLGDMLIVLAVTAAALGVASFRFARKDIGR